MFKPPSGRMWSLGFLLCFTKPHVKGVSFYFSDKIFVYVALVFYRLSFSGLFPFFFLSYDRYSINIYEINEKIPEKIDIFFM